MAEGVLGLGSGASSLNNELIEKLKEAERASTVAPIETSIENISGEGGESEKLAEIIAKANELLETIKPFDLFVSGGQTAFDNKTANATGSSVVFDAVDAGSINEGTTYVNVSQLAQRDVYQTNSFSDATATISSGSGDMIILAQSGRPIYQTDVTIATTTELVDASGGTITVNAGGTDKIFTVTATMTYSDLVDLIDADADLDARISDSGRLSINHADDETSLTITEALTTNTIGLSSAGEKYSTEGVTYEELAASITFNSNYTATVEAVGSNSNRIVIKSLESGLDNAITITQNGVDLGLNDVLNHTVTAQNLMATVDGVDYDVSSNVLIVDGGLKITAVEAGDSSISVNNDTTTLEPAMQLFVTAYNELVALVDEELYSSDSNIEDKATLRSMMSDIKDKMFGSYGTSDDLNIFNFGFEIDKGGVLSLDSAKFNEATESDIESLKSLFLGVAEDEGLGTQLKEYVDALDGFEGLLSIYETNIASRLDSLEEEEEKAIEILDNKYSLLAQQFASYNAIINQFETQFSGLKLMIEQSTAS